MKFFAFLFASTVTVAYAGVLDREPGIKLMNQRLTLKPYVALSYTYDSNVDTSKSARDGSQWVVNPGMSANYSDDNWAVEATVWYKYHAYNDYSTLLNSSSYGESIKGTWTNAEPGGPGYSASFSQRFEQIAQDDCLSALHGRGINRDRRQFEIEGVFQRRFSKYFHGALKSDYYNLDYDNNAKEYAWLYSWSRLQIGGELGWTVSRWTDLLLSANYQWYWHDNDVDKSNSSNVGSRPGHHVRGDSKGWSIMAGVGTHMTEKLSYRLLAGWSSFEYGGGVSTIDGWTYQVNADWQVDAANTMHIMAIASSYYQPSEREFGSALKVHNVSFGIAKSFVRNKLKTSFDIAFRRETNEYTEYEAYNYDEDIWTVRLAVAYRFNRLLEVFGRLEYQIDDATGAYINDNVYDYDRWRATIGLRMSW